MCRPVRPSSIARLVSAPDLKERNSKSEYIQIKSNHHLEQHFGALFSRSLLDPGGDVERRLADLAAADVDLQECNSIDSFSSQNLSRACPKQKSPMSCLKFGAMS